MWLPEIITSLYESGARTEHLLKNTFKSLMFTGGVAPCSNSQRLAAGWSFGGEDFLQEKVVLQKSMTRVALLQDAAVFASPFLAQPGNRAANKASRSSLDLIHINPPPRSRSLHHLLAFSDYFFFFIIFFFLCVCVLRCRYKKPCVKIFA